VSPELYPHLGPRLRAAEGSPEPRENARTTGSGRLSNASVALADAAGCRPLYRRNRSVSEDVGKAQGLKPRADQTKPFQGCELRHSATEEMVATGGSETGRRIAVNGANLCVCDMGQGQPVVLVQPRLLSSEVYTDLATRLAARFRVITFDSRGHGDRRIRVGT